MKKSILIFISFSILFPIELNDYECNISKLSNISSNRALTTLKALGYYVIEHENIYVEEEITENLQPEEFDLEEVQGIFIVNIPDSQNSTLNPTSDEEEEEEGFNKYLSGVSMGSSTDSDPIERIMVCYDKEQTNLYNSFLDILYNQLDVPAKQILIEALVLEINSDDLKDTGISSQYVNQDNHLSIQTPNKTDGNALSILYSENNFTDADGYILDDLFQIQINALINSQSTEILSRPSILVLDGRQARIQVGKQIPITKAYSGGDDLVYEDVEYLPVGIVLNLKPRISNDMENVTMQIETIITEAETDDFNSGNILEAPIINNRKVESFVRVADNTPFIIGGLISNTESDNIGKIPLLWKVPWLGKLFTWEGKKTEKKEVIVVITPHIIEDNSDNFSRVIPQDASMFDSFDNKLFPNSYRLKESDIYDLNFITESSYLNSIRYKASGSTGLTTDEKFIIERIKNGFIPGENIITQRMIYDIIENQNYFTSVDSDKIIFFNHSKNHTVDKIKNYFSIIDDPRRAILVSINDEISNEQNFFRPSMNIEEIVLTEEYNYKDLLKEYWLKNKNSKPILIANQKNLKRLYEILVLQEVLKLNNTLTLSIDEFQRGLQIQFPAKEIIMNNTFVIDEKIADYFYQVNFYYESFEEEFKNKTKFLSD
tara:strand:- start:899 stop:2878 length:1980 start_codon:yes stop_codon:yes gene_type:complete